MTRALVALLGASLAAAAAAAQPTPADIDALRKIVARDHSYTPAARAEALARVERLTPLLADQPRFELEAARIIALADNGHSSLYPAEWTLRYPRSPVRVGLFADGLFVIDAPALHRAALGRRVTTINGHPWRAAHTAFKRYQGGTQSWRDQFFEYFVEAPALLAAAGIGEDRNHLRLGLAGGGTITATPVMAPLEGEDGYFGSPLPRVATALLRGPRPLYLTHPDQYYWFEALPALSAAYIRIDAIGGDKLEPFLESSLERMRGARQCNIILDLRFNHGGDLNRSRDFARALPALAKGGRVYVITSGKTFSAAISTMGYLKQTAPGRVTIVGEPIGDRLEFWAEGGWQDLPGLGAKILTATERHNYRTGCPEADCHGSIREHPIRVETLQPDIAAPMTFAAYRAGRDPAMEAITRAIRRR